MSRYADKHHVAPDCARPDCPHPGKVLRLIGHTPCWLCEPCAEIVDARIRGR